MSGFVIRALATLAGGRSCQLTGTLFDILETESTPPAESQRGLETTRAPACGALVARRLGRRVRT